MTAIQPMYLREIAVGEPEIDNLPTFAVEAFERRGSHHIDRRDRLIEDLGETAETWLKENAVRPWTYVERIHRPRHPREVQRQRYLLFAAVDDAERFGWANRAALAQARLADMDREVRRFVAYLWKDVDAHRYDAWRRPIRQTFRRFEDLRRRMRHAAGFIRRADDLMKQERVRYRMRNGWLRRAAEPLTVPPCVEEAIRAGDLSDHPRLLAELQEDVDSMFFNLSIVDEHQWIERVNEFVWRARRIRMAWRFANQHRRRQGLEPIGEPFTCPS